MTNAVLPIEVTLPASDAEDLTVLRGLVQRAEQGDTQALAELRAKFAAVPAAWEPFGNMAVDAQRAWITLATGGNPLMEEAIAKTSGRLRAELLGASPSPLERLLVERIIGCWLQVQYADCQAAAFERSGERVSQGEYWHPQQERVVTPFGSEIRDG